MKKIVYILPIYQSKLNIGQNLWVLAENAYGLWVAIFCKSTRWTIYGL